MLPFELPVRLNANGSPAEIAQRLSQLIAPPFSFFGPERKKPLRGHISTQGGVLRWPLAQRGFSSARNLYFSLVETSHGSALQGAFRLGLPIRIYAAVWVGFDLIFGSSLLYGDLIHHSPGIEVLRQLGSMLLMICAAAAYVGVVVLVGRSKDGSLIRVLRVSLASQTGTDAVDHIFAPDKNAKTKFVDDPEEL